MSPRIGTVETSFKKTADALINAHLKQGGKLSDSNLLDTLIKKLSLTRKTDNSDIFVSSKLQ